MAVSGGGTLWSNWDFNCFFWHQVPREGLHWKHISVISCFPCMQICWRCSHIAYTRYSFLADVWEKTGNGRVENDRVMSQRKQSSPFSCQHQTLSVCVQRKQKSGGDYISYNPERGASVLRVWRLSWSLIVSSQSSGVALIWISVCCREWVTTSPLPPSLLMFHPTSCKASSPSSFIRSAVSLRHPHTHTC